MTDKLLTALARHVLATFLLSLGILPIEGEDDDTFEIKDYGPHRVYTQLARVPDRLADSIDPAETLDKLSHFLNSYNALPTSVKYQPHSAEVYTCPCGCGTFLYISICHTATA